MAEKRLRIWFDREADYLEVTFDQRPGFFRETANDQVMERPRFASAVSRKFL